MLKVAKVIPVFKKGLASKLSNYRPMSLLLSIFSRLFKKLMYERIHNFLERYEWLFSIQFGFRSGHSTDHALISLTESIRSSLDSNRVGCGIFINLQKAFDTVSIYLVYLVHLTFFYLMLLVFSSCFVFFTLLLLTPLLVRGSLSISLDYIGSSSLVQLIIY